jgi:hypothetical protein
MEPLKPTSSPLAPGINPLVACPLEPAPNAG